MNQRFAHSDFDSSTALKVVAAPTLPRLDPGRLWDIGKSAQAVYEAATILRAIGNYPEDEGIRESWWKVFHEAMDDLMKARNDG